ncbi:MAG: hypothetical protein EPN41_01570 [Candidimonas sp.]|nr:MAG: hypothetical protein EPN41_01570 [Candidimonas sp.]
MKISPNESHDVTSRGARQSQQPLWVDGATKRAGQPRPLAHPRPPEWGISPKFTSASGNCGYFDDYSTYNLSWVFFEQIHRVGG